MRGIDFELTQYKKTARYTSIDSINQLKYYLGIGTREDDFTIEVKKITLPEDFKKNKHILHLIAKLDRWFFLQLLKIGYNIEESLRQLSHLIYLDDTTTLSKDEIMYIAITEKKFLNK